MQLETFRQMSEEIRPFGGADENYRDPCSYRRSMLRHAGCTINTTIFTAEELGRVETLEAALLAKVTLKMTWTSFLAMYTLRRVLRQRPYAVY